MADLIAPVMSRYTNFAMTTDGIAEINSLIYMPFESDYADPLPTQRLVIVLVEPRLLNAAGDPALLTDFMRCLLRFKGDIRAEGLLSRFIIADLYNGPVHKDGRILLALRQFFKDVKSAFVNFEGAILIGNFPDATLVRTVAWRPGFINPPRLAIWPELISERADIVLADLTGNWETLYRRDDFDAEAIDATPDAATSARGWFDGESVRNCEFTSTDFNVHRSTIFRDAFFIDDAIYTISEHIPDSFIRIVLNQAERNNEVDVSDHSTSNVIARPDISISRINAYHVAANPNPLLMGTDGHTFLNGAGNPQIVTSPTPLFNGPEHLELFNFKDPALEKRMLISYFKRNHRFRIGAYSGLPFRTAVVSGTAQFPPAPYEQLINAAASDFQPSVVMQDANLQQYVQFHKSPAVLKYIMAHSDSVISQFNNTGDVATLTAEVGGIPLRWLYSSGQHTPTFDANGGNAEIYIHRALWHYNTLQNAGASLIIHGGCNVNSVAETQSDTYASANYARANNAECILFFTNCVSLMSRAKGFNDAPNGFTEGYRFPGRPNFGNCWKNYFDVQANDSGLSAYNIQRKRPYFWSINGDWTLRLRNNNGLSTLALDITSNVSLQSTEVHPNGAWIDGWNYETALNNIRGIGDIDGDGIDEFVITSDWGIGILKYNGTSFRALMQAPRDTWFGGWRYDATINTGRDVITDVQNFTGMAFNEIMIWSSWGITTLGYDGTSLIPTRIHCNGTRLGGWLFNTGNNVYCGSGQFDNDGCKDMVLTSPWGIGIISMQHSTDIFLAPNGSIFGNWHFNSGTDTIRLIADFDGDGNDEILISSPWGIGVLKLVGGVLTSIAMNMNGNDLGGYVVSNLDNFVLADNLKAGTPKQILVTNSAGIHMLALAGNFLERHAFVQNGSRIEGWLVETNNNQVRSAGDLNGDGLAEFIIRSPWGIGVFGVYPSNQFRCFGLFPNGSMLNDWFLQSTDIIVGSGNFFADADRKELLIVK